MEAKVAQNARIESAQRRVSRSRALPALPLRNHLAPEVACSLQHRLDYLCLIGKSGARGRRDTAPGCLKASALGVTDSGIAKAITREDPQGSCFALVA